MKSTKEGRRLKWYEGEVKILIKVYDQEYQQKAKGKSLDSMWEKVARRVNTESKEIDASTGEKSGKQCKNKVEI